MPSIFFLKTMIQCDLRLLYSQALVNFSQETWERDCWGKNKQPRLHLVAIHSPQNCVQIGSIIDSWNSREIVITLVMSIITHLSTRKTKYYIWKYFVMLSSKRPFLLSIRSDAIIIQLAKNILLIKPFLCTLLMQHHNFAVMIQTIVLMWLICQYNGK